MARIIAIGGLKGGTGKSTLSVNLACQLAGAMRVQLIDVDRQASAHEWIAGGMLPVTGIALPLDDQRGAAAWIRRVSAIDMDVVVIDLPPQIGAATAAALIVADLFLVPVAPSALDLRAASKALDLLQEARRPGEMESQLRCWCRPRWTGAPVWVGKSKRRYMRWGIRSVRPSDCGPLSSIAPLPRIGLAISRRGQWRTRK